MLDSFVNRPAAPKFTLAEPPTENDEELAPEPVQAEHPSDPADDIDPVMPEEPWVYEEPATVEQSAGEPAKSITIGIEDEAPLIIVEDDPRVSRTVRVPSPAVKRQEYRQLFARLRRS
jgi:hypothetical protein